MAETKCKYYKQKRQVSYDGGQTWQDVIPYQYQKGDLYEYESADCGALVVYRWINMDSSVDYYCEGTTKYYKQKRQVSYDGGQTWQDVTPAEYQRGGVAESQSIDCGYVPPVTQYRWIKSDDTICVETPTPTDKKLVATYSDSTTREVECNDSTELTSGDTKPSGYVASAMTNAVIGDCVTSIGNSVFRNCSGLTSCTIGSGVTTIGERVFQGCRSLTSVNIPSGVTIINLSTFNRCDSLTSVTIPNSVTSIGQSAFAYCSGLTSCTIGSGVTYIGQSAFYGCGSLTSIIINATTPPTLGTDVFNDTNNCPIYVPAESVDAYKAAWSDLASRIQPIP